MGVGWASESCAAAKPATGGGSRRYRRWWFGRLKQEYPRLKKKHDICWMDIQRPLLLESCVDYKLTKPCVRINLLGPQVCGREHIAHLRFVILYNPFLNSNGIYYSPFTVC